MDKPTSTNCVHCTIDGGNAGTALHSLMYRYRNFFIFPIDAGKAVRALHLFRFNVSKFVKFPIDSGNVVRSLLPVPSEPPIMIVLRLHARGNGVGGVSATVIANTK